MATPAAVLPLLPLLVLFLVPSGPRVGLPRALSARAGRLPPHPDAPALRRGRIAREAPGPEDWTPQCLHASGGGDPGEGRGRRFDYCSCAEGQEALFSSGLVRSRVESGFGSRGPGRVRLLMLAAEGEQLSKGRQHLAGAMAFAKALNRTLVLPNVGGSVLAMDRAMHPCAYFDTAKLGGYVDWVSQRAFLRHLPKLDGGAKASVFILGVNNSWAWNFLEQRSLEVLGPELEALVSLADVYFVNQWGNYKEQLEELLPKVEDSDLVVFIKSGDGFFIDKERFDEALAAVDYAPHLVSIAHRAIEEILQAPQGAAQGVPQPKLLAAQLRIEKFLRSDDPPFEQCMAGAIKGLKEEKDKSGTSHTFLAADISIHGHFFSASFNGLPAREKLMAVEGIKELSRELAPATWAELDPGFPDLDAGVQGILDKLVCVFADQFVVPTECAKLSSYTEEIIERRASANQPKQ